MFFIEKLHLGPFYLHGCQINYIFAQNISDFVMTRLNKIKKKIRIHREGTHILITSALILLLLNAAIYWGTSCELLFTIVLVVSVILYALMINFFRCPIRLFNGDTEKIVVAPADGKVVVIEEVDEYEYFHDRRLMVSIFMDITNVHANWYPVDGTVKHVDHHNGCLLYTSDAADE